MGGKLFCSVLIQEGLFFSSSSFFSSAFSRSLSSFSSFSFFSFFIFSIQGIQRHGQTRDSHLSDHGIVGVQDGIIVVLQFGHI